MPMTWTVVGGNNCSGSSNQSIVANVLAFHRALTNNVISNVDEAAYQQFVGEEIAKKKKYSATAMRIEPLK